QEHRPEHTHECQERHTNNNTDDTTARTQQEHKTPRATPPPADTIKRGYGNGRDIDMLFAAMATAAGFETRLINLPDRGDMFFNPNIADNYFLSVYDVAVKVGADWKFVDPSSNYVPFCMLRWQKEGEAALLAGPTEPGFLH